MLTLSFKFLRSQSDQVSVRCAGQTSLIYVGPTSHFTEFKGTAANISMPEVLWSPYLDGSEQFWGHKRDKHRIREMVLMSWMTNVH